MWVLCGCALTLRVALSAGARGFSTHPAGPAGHFESGAREFSADSPWPCGSLWVRGRTDFRRTHPGLAGHLQRGFLGRSPPPDSRQVDGMRTTAPPVCVARSFGRLSVEVAALGRGEELAPLRGGEDQLWAVGFFGVADRRHRGCECDLDAVAAAAGVASAALAPARPGEIHGEHDHPPRFRFTTRSSPRRPRPSNPLGRARWCGGARI